MIPVSTAIVTSCEKVKKNGKILLNVYFRIPLKRDNPLNFSIKPRFFSLQPWIESSLQQKSEDSILKMRVQYYSIA